MGEKQENSLAARKSTSQQIGFYDNKYKPIALQSNTFHVDIIWHELVKMLWIISSNIIRVMTLGSLYVFQICPDSYFIWLLPTYIYGSHWNKYS